MRKDKSDSIDNLFFPIGNQFIENFVRITTTKEIDEDGNEIIVKGRFPKWVPISVNYDGICMWVTFNEFAYKKGMYEGEIIE